jgi:hypothetical protein
MITPEEVLEVCTLEVANRGVVELWKWCCDTAERPDEDLSPAAGIAAALDAVMLSEAAEAVRSKLKRIEDDPDWESWKRAEWGLAEKWGDRDNMGELVKDPESGAVQITEHKVEMEKDRAELQKSEKFKDMWDRLEEGRKENEETLSGACRVRMCCLKNLEDAPRKTLIPRLLTILMGGSVRAILNAASSSSAEEPRAEETSEKADPVPFEIVKTESAPENETEG